ncbi:unnamed protein product [Adineta steineri]|uniref:RUN domain-containing protein n=1 Tax=Adineta steineri TaxID=433720 RepID=A0A815TA36_9BILA|nr:unnamed protein product [Adineta steineri]
MFDIRWNYPVPDSVTPPMEIAEKKGSDLGDKDFRNMTFLECVKNGHFGSPLFLFYLFTKKNKISGEQILNPFQCSYRGRVLYHYPNEVLNNPFDEDAISRLSMPDGVSIRLNSPDPPTTHPFLITRLDGTRYYGRNSRLTRSFQSKHTPRRVTRIKKQQTLATGEHQQPVVLVENEVVFQQLLKECTTKTKRMVIEKMEDIVEGSSPIKNNESTSMVNLEENVLIAGFCDLLERIWSHGLHHRPSGKSALWNHIKCYVKLKNYESAQISHGGLPVNYTKDENPALVWCLMRKQLVNRSVSATRSESPGGHRSHTLPRPQMSQHQPRSSPILSMTNSTLSLLPSDNLMKNHPSSTSLLYDFRSIELCFGHNPVGISKRNSRLTRSFQSKHTPRRVTRIKKQQTLATGEHQQPVVLVENEVVFQQLLKECTTKTKRMVIEKMEDIVEGSSPIKNNESTSMVNLEENVLIAGFCDLLERIWSHGLHHRPSGKSALWNHVKCYVKLKNYESAQISHGGLPINYTKDENPALVWCLMRKQLVNRSVSATRSESPGGHRSHTLPRPQMSQHQPRSSPILSMTNSTLSLLPSDNLMKNHPSSTSLLYDFRSIELCFGHNPVSLSASEIGFARAFVRLALERRLLSRHLSELFSHSDLLQALYKRDAFLRADDGDLRKQFLAHVESLQLLDYKCFSNSYADIDIIYHVTIVPTRARTTGISSTTTANPYIAVAGILGSTKVIPLPSKNTPEVKFKHKNLGQLTTLRIGHDNTGLMPRWNLDHVLVRNQLTNNVYRFPCGRWLGKGVDDDSLERLLFVDTTGSFEMNDNPTNGTFESGSPSQLMTTSMISGGSQLNLSVAGRSRSPSLRRANDQKNQSNQQADDIYELLGRSINQLVKYFDDPEKKRGLITPILCGEDGLVNALEKTLSYGLKKPTSNLSFFGGGRKRYVWDFLIKVCDEYDARRSQWQRSEREKAIICYINGVRSIEKALATFGKDGRFQSWCCFACKLHLLSDWFRLLSQCSDACLTQFYDPLNNCFRQKKLNQFINNILEPVKDFDFAHLEPALLKGLAGV